MTPEFSITSSYLPENGKSSKYKPLETVFRRKTENDRHLRIISPEEKTCIWDGIIMDNTLFLRDNGLEHVSLKESIVALIELTEEYLQCNTLVICLDKNNPILSTLIRCLFYFGFELVSPDTYNHSNEFILVGMEF